jgi:hypothetical protein
MRIPRLRFTVRRMMVAVALLGLIFLLGVPLYRVGPPPCLSPRDTLSWLLAHPGRAHCADCHGVATSAVILTQSALPAKSSIEACPRATPFVGARQSQCVTCHQRGVDRE